VIRGPSISDTNGWQMEPRLVGEVTAECGDVCERYAGWNSSTTFSERVLGQDLLAAGVL